jgi:uncharacterized phage-like protein YoqJ
MEKSGEICCFTGHRILSREEWGVINSTLEGGIRELYRTGYRYFISGAARGFDTYAAATVIALKKELPEISLWLAVPYNGHTKLWNKEEIERFDRVRMFCDREEILASKYYAGCYDMRNRWMVDKASACIACYNGENRGGTAKTVSYAVSKGMQVINVLT